MRQSEGTKDEMTCDTQSARMSQSIFEVRDNVTFVRFVHPLKLKARK
ncbi:hypothetical protein [Candidatus Nitrosotenuis cloacae]|nr:hypothetical protein [Candidatus Nitrosotenuis cloacae]